MMAMILTLTAMNAPGANARAQDEPPTYEGRSRAAAWRDAAAERIDRYRKADMAITVIDEDGRPVPGAKVHVRMRRHAFWFGSAVKLWKIARNQGDDRIYRRHIDELFNHAVNENDLKWPQWDNNSGRRTRSRAIEGLKWLAGRRIHVKGHNMIWPSWKRTPDRLKELKDDPDALRRAIAEHIEDVATATNEWVDEWDVINEPFSNTELIDTLGAEAMVRWFELARRQAPQATLYLNDYGIIAAGGRRRTRHQQHHKQTIEMLLESGAPLDALGMQCHFDEASLTPPEIAYQILNQYARYDLPIQITEFDVNTTDERLQADYLRDFMTLAFSHPSVNGFVLWGFHEANHWRPQAALYRSDWSIKPSGEAYKKLVLDAWSTDKTARTDANGRAVFRVFKGDYEVELTHGRVQAVSRMSLERDKQFKLKVAGGK
ncbi:MAG: hypothetical protein GVY28_08475 [Alphaproteobacteria bacterium]|jgi:GH35 family endo-1,4-beta-xylanase|nr:hypothetical protein [Alphaproteobacteria bacterium]